MFFSASSRTADTLHPCRLRGGARLEENGFLDVGVETFAFTFG
jgi:hypothetical protein